MTSRLLAGGGGAGLLMWSGLSGLDDGMTRIVVPGTSVLTLSQPGAYTIYHEPESVIDGKIYASENVNGLRVAVAEDGGEQVTVTSPGMHSTYSIGGHHGVSVLAFEITKPGRYRLTAAYPGGRSEPVAVLAVGQGFVGRLVMTILGAVGSGLIGFFAALTIALVTFFQRRKMRRRTVAAGI
jgi:hypothetical protein